MKKYIYLRAFAIREVANVTMALWSQTVGWTESTQEYGRLRQEYHKFPGQHEVHREILS